MIQKLGAVNLLFRTDSVGFENTQIMKSEKNLTNLMMMLLQP